MRGMKTLALACLPVLVFALVATAQVRSVYTSLEPKACKEAKYGNEDGVDYEGICPGTGGYKLRLTEGDLRQSLDLIAPNKKEVKLAFWYVSPAFSYLGDRVEWRLRGKKPIAFIARFNANQDPESTTKVTSYLVVVKVSQTRSCVTDVVDPSRTQNVEARKLADKAASKPCKFTDVE